MWFVYILECSDKTFYTGITTDVEKRIKVHNAGKGSKYCKMRLPVKLVASFSFNNRSMASKEEYKIKQLTKDEKIRLIESSS